VRSFTVRTLIADLLEKNYRMIPFSISHLDIQVVGERRSKKYGTTYANHLADLDHLIPGLYKMAIGFRKLNGRWLFNVKGICSDWFSDANFGVGSSNVYAEAPIVVYSSAALYDRRLKMSYLSRTSTIHLLF
jgi:hypothetical protein